MSTRVVLSVAALGGRGHAATGVRRASPRHSVWRSNDPDSCVTATQADPASRRCTARS
jgi:hypothetical protein